MRVHNNFIKTTVVLLFGLTPLSASAAGRIWDYWYTATILPSTKYAYYHESAEVKQDRIHFQSQIWKKEEGFINEEQLGAFALNNDKLTPLFFNFRGTYRASETTIDATIKDGKLQAKINRNFEEQPLINRGISSATIFSSHFPLWLQKQLKNTPADKAGSLNVSFLTLWEDRIEAPSNPESGRVRAVEADEFAKKNNAIKVEVTFSTPDARSVWYVDKDGIPIRFEIPAQNTRVERVSEKVARKFLN